MAVTITREPRDAIREAVMNHLSGIGDVWLLIESGEFTKAQRLGRTFAEDVRLLEDLGWSPRMDAEAVTLTMPARELAQTVRRLHSDATGGLAAHVSRPKDEEEIAQRQVVAADARATILGRIADPAGDKDDREVER